MVFLHLDQIKATEANEKDMMTFAVCSVYYKHY